MEFLSAKGPESKHLSGTGLPEWRVATVPVPYETALAEMAARAAAIAKGTAPELVWLLEHPALYTAGRGAQDSDLLDRRFPVFEAPRGGQHTYHGPGQRVAYVLLDLNARGRDIRAYVHNLEAWLIRALARLGITAERRAGRVGLWVPRGDGSGLDDKIAAIGVRAARWVTSHGVSVNVDPDLSHYAGIVPCGIAEHGVTSLAQLGNPATLADLDAALRAAWDKVF